MGIDYDAHIGYGVMVPKSLEPEWLEEIAERNIDKDRFAVMCWGDSYTWDDDDECEHTNMIIVVKESHEDTWHNCPHPVNKLFDPNNVDIPRWDDMLRKECERVGIDFDKEKPQWYLTCHVC